MSHWAGVSRLLLSLALTTLSVALPAAEPIPGSELVSPVSGAAQQQSLLQAPEVPDLPDERFPGETGPEYKPCNTPSLSLDASLANDNRRTTGLVLGEGGLNPPVQQTRITGGVDNLWCQDADIEFSAWYSLHDASDFEETRFAGRGILEVLPRVRAYGGFAYFNNPEGVFQRDSLYLIGGVEYPSFWETTVYADYLRDVRENGDWFTAQISRAHRLGATRRGAVFTYRHGFGVTLTQKLPMNEVTPSLTGIPSTFYRAILEIEDGPVIWYAEVSPHVSLVGEGSGVRKTHVLVAVGMKFDLP